MYGNTRKAFTMLELVFVIAVIGILSAIAIPKFAATRDDALVIKGKTTLAAVRNAINTERQQRILRGDFTQITNLNNGGIGTFTFFNLDNRNIANRVLEYPVPSCVNAGCWLSTSPSTYNFYMPVPAGATCTYTLGIRRLDLTAANGGVTMALCRQLLEE